MQYIESSYWNFKKSPLLRSWEFLYAPNGNTNAIANSQYIEPPCLAMALVLPLGAYNPFLKHSKKGFGNLCFYPLHPISNTSVVGWSSVDESCPLVLYLEDVSACSIMGVVTNK